METLTHQDALIKQLFWYLDYTETTDSGREWHPISISCSRVMMSEGLARCLKELKETLIECD